MKLIDAAALIAELNAINAPYSADINNAITNAPTIAAVQVVRCKECVYRPCKQMPYSYDHDYCSYGERNRDEID